MFKRIFTLIVLCVISSQQIHSQQTDNEKERKTSFGVKIGYNGTNYVDLFNSVPYGGFFAETRLNESWDLQNGIFFSYDGITYLEVPVLLKYNVTDSFGIVFGPRLDFNLTKENKMTPEITYNRLLPSIEGGFQYEITNRIFMETKISYTLIRPYENSHPLRTPLLRNNVRFGVGYRF